MPRHRSGSRWLVAAASLAVVVGAGGFALNVHHPRTTSTPAGGAAAGPAGTSAPSPALGPEELPSCQLPVTLSGNGAAGYGFVNFPAGTYSAVSPGDKSIVAYDPIRETWLTHGRAPSPDGRSYAYLEPVHTGHYAESPLHVVDEASGNDRIAPTSAPVEAILGWSDQGIAVAEGRQGHGLGSFLVDPVSGASTALPAAAGYRPTVTKDAIWANRIFTGPGAQTTNALDVGLDRVDLRDGSSQLWFNPVAYFGPAAPETSSMNAAGGAHTAQGNMRSWQLEGFTESGQPVIGTGTRDPGTPRSTIVVVAPGQWQVVWRGVAQEAGGLDAESVRADHGGLWFGGFDGSSGGMISRWTPAGGWHPVARLASTDPSFSPRVVGQCG